jgi:hypothetical protein
LPPSGDVSSPATTLVSLAGDRDGGDAVNVSRHHVRRVLAEFDEAGYVDREETDAGRANVYRPRAQSGTGEVVLPNRDAAVASTAATDDDPGPAKN